MTSEDYEDKHNSKERHVRFQDRMPEYLILIVLFMFFIILLIFMLYPVQGAAKDITNILIGSVAIWCGQGINFYFGTTRSSAVKTQLLAESANLGKEK